MYLISLPGTNLGHCFNSKAKILVGNKKNLNSWFGPHASRGKGQRANQSFKFELKTAN